MKPIYQTKFGSTEGNCWAACLATIFEIDLSSIPNFAQYKSRWFEEFDKWLYETLNMTAILISAAHDPDNPKKVFPGDSIYNFPPKTYYILSGKSPRGDYDHALVYNGTDLVHDPFPGGDGELESVRDFCIFIPLL